MHYPPTRTIFSPAGFTAEGTVGPFTAPERLGVGIHTVLMIPQLWLAGHFHMDRGRYPGAVIMRARTSIRGESRICSDQEGD